ncbi:quinone oxidoreductase family protein [Staphylococcus agnetis]|uniref:quinone oxidoreductase family protein n=1 Tax=Staphylococcus agnetis TaxID=985762 RepID=UPI000D19896C|nr:zinc-binding alcohol dehydrogenase family protein [Staphylococcus agnetis]PTH46977.1 alcohol dehydrogenase [Staphylococcus agnetis]
MKVLTIVNTKLVSPEDITMLPDVKIANSLIHCGLIDVHQPTFNSDREENDHFVLVRVDALSCNYRDKAIILKSALKMQEDLNYQSAPFAFFGSDFVGTIVEKGRLVNEFHVGQRVIPNCAYPESPFPGVAAGVVTNEASKGWLRIHKSKLVSIPKKMNNEIAASFSIGGQTSTSMVRRVGINSGENALVLSGRSNTSMFIINNLLQKGIDTTVLTTSDWSENEKKLINPAKLIKVDRTKHNWDEYLNNYDVVFDPYFDLHLENAVNQLKVGGRYITCGYKNQHKQFFEHSDDLVSNNLKNIMLKVMINNMSLIGNCIGTTDDLVEAIRNYDEDSFVVPIDSTFKVEEGNKFVDRTYNNRGRLGKSILLYKQEVL